MRKEKLTENQGQRKKLVKDETVKALFDLYGVVYEEVNE